MTLEHKKQEIELARSACGGSHIAELILDLWQRTRIDWSFATDHLSASFRAHRSLGSAERRFVAETLFGMIRHLRRIDGGLSRGGHVQGKRAPDRARMVAYFVLELGLGHGDAAAAVPEIDWPAVAGIDDAIAGERDAVRRIAIGHSQPDWLAKRLVGDLGADEAEALCAALNQRAPMTLRANRLRTNPDELTAQLAERGLRAEPGRWAPDALGLVDRTNVFSLPEFREGRFEAQDEGSQLIAELVAPPPRSVVVDYCAGAGGKTLALAATLDNRGRVVACDVAKRKLSELRRRCKRAGATNVQSVILDGEGWAKPLDRVEGNAPRVLADVPCTGIGALRRNPEARWRLTPADLERLPETQFRIAERALSLVAPGGRLIYATCTVLRAENHAVVERLLARHSDLQVMSPREVWGAERADPLTSDAGFLELFPHRHGTDGFFAAVLRRQKQQS